MITLMAPSFTVSFRRPASPSYHEAVRLAKQAHAYVETLESAGLTHHASFGATPEQWGLLAELWGLVRSWRASRLTVDGRPVLGSDRGRILVVLECAARAAQFAPPQRYCASAPVQDSPSWPGRPHFPCRHLVLGGLGHYLDTRVDWDAPTRWRDQLRALLLEQGIAWCPFLSLHPFERALEEWAPRRARPLPLRFRVFGEEEEEP